MVDSEEIQFVDESEYQNEGKWYFWTDHSQREIGSTISLDSNDSLSGISDFSAEVESENSTCSDSDYSHVGGASCENDTDSEHVQELSTSAGNRRGKKSRNVVQDDFT